jgi:hypothetical protein
VPPCASRNTRGYAIFDLRGIGREFLAERQRSRVLQMGAADLHDRIPPFRLVGQPLVHHLQRREQLHVHGLRRRNVHGRWEAVVRRLALVHMVVRMNRRLAAALAGENLIGSAGDHLIGVHV